MIDWRQLTIDLVDHYNARYASLKYEEEVIDRLNERLEEALGEGAAECDKAGG